MTKVKKIIESEQYKSFEKMKMIRLYEKEQFSVGNLDNIMKHLMRKFCELFLEYYHGNSRALKKESVDLANISMFIYLYIEDFRDE